MPEEKKYVYTIKDIPLTPLTETISTRFLLGEKILISFIEEPPDTEFEVHSHDCEQILIYLEGSEEKIIDGKTYHMEAGDVCIQPANVPHGGKTLTGFKGIDIFAPPRKEHVERMKKYGRIK